MALTDTSTRIVHPDLRPDSLKFRRAEMEKIARELCAKYRDELQRASWWKRILLRLKIKMETSRIFTGRLHASAKTKRPSSSDR